jgi:hypothetical protein
VHQRPAAGQMTDHRLDLRPLQVVECDRRHVRDHIVAKSDGVPLYVEELTKAILGSRVLEARGDAYVLTGSLAQLHIPATLHDSLMARLDRALRLRDVDQHAQRFQCRRIGPVQIFSCHQQRGAFGRFDQPGNNRIHGRIAPLLRRHRQARIAVFG